MMTLTESTRTYSSIENLKKALEKFGFAEDRHLVVWTENGRCTAVFPASNIQGGYIGRYACKGFFTLG